MSDDKNSLSVGRSIVGLVLVCQIYTERPILGMPLSAGKVCNPAIRAGRVDREKRPISTEREGLPRGTKRILPSGQPLDIEIGPESPWLMREKGFAIRGCVNMGSFSSTD